MATKVPSLFLILLHLCSSTSLTLNLSRNDFSDSIQPSDHFPNIIRPNVTRSNVIFTIEANIGTPSTKKAFIFNPGSELTWSQCAPCINCFEQKYPLFDPMKSKSYKKLPPNHTFSRYFWQSNNGDLIFYLLYGTGESASGIVSIETFSFPNHRKIYEKISGVVFGCAYNQRGRFKSSITGIMGMNKSPLSLISQMRVQRFSYCLPPIYSSTKTTPLSFGNDVKVTRSFQETSFINYIDYNYRVNLLDLSIGGHRLNLPYGTFKTGCMLDIGCGGSYLETRAYNVVVRVLIQYFNGFNLTRSPSGLNSLGNLCYRLHPGFRHYPSMTFHFMGANLEIRPEDLFQVVSDRFCLAMFGKDDTTILGAYQQQNVRFVFDIEKQNVLFSREDFYFFLNARTLTPGLDPESEV